MSKKGNAGPFMDALHDVMEISRTYDYESFGFFFLVIQNLDFLFQHLLDSSSSTLYLLPNVTVGRYLGSTYLFYGTYDMVLYLNIYYKNYIAAATIKKNLKNSYLLIE